MRIGDIGNITQADQVSLDAGVSRKLNLETPMRRAATGERAWSTAHSCRHSFPKFGVLGPRRLDHLALRKNFSLLSGRPFRNSISHLPKRRTRIKHPVKLPRRTSQLLCS
ncbi:hypothetical protein F3P66_25460 (plasmid) [Agrobacterium fabrum]|uniref:Uncharacterized protein n=1 Tax=Agrobacterium fabrum (strain C58 / ATCC 33970) TaxID=176299 RepID=A8WFH9_AGRFC|nr:hypothetical protein Atu8057 [Agrobacterium fabrum str. C58]QRM62712.1 hypothetical protein F3P66_25460 [Agrobacterium fabrum]TRB28176.1 hypothetical protein EXN51_16150 [Agrobacterium fabrum]